MPGVPARLGGAWQPQDNANPDPTNFDEKTYTLAQELRRRREPSRSGGKHAARPHVLTRLLRCGHCGASYQLETSGKRIDGNLYRYCYYNCRRATRIGVGACSGFRIATDILDQAVLEALANHVCSGERVRRLAMERGWPAEQLRSAWRALVTCDPDTARAYALHLGSSPSARSTNLVP